jgi:hypothetical protein
VGLVGQYSALQYSALNLILNARYFRVSRKFILKTKILKKLGKQIQSMTIVGDCGKQNPKFKGHDAWGGNKIKDTFSRMPRCSTVQVSEYGTSKHCRWCHERVRYGHRPVEVTGQGIV